VAESTRERIIGAAAALLAGGGKGWDLHVGFGLAQPAFYTLIYGKPGPGIDSHAAREAAAILAKQMRRIAEAGRLRVSEERAAQLIYAAGSGMTLTLIALPPERRDPALSRMAREAIITTVTTDDPRTVEGRTAR
jgi:hypothetical protein